MSVTPSWPLIGSLSLMVVVLSMSVGAVLGHLRSAFVHRDPIGRRALIVFAAEVVLLGAVLVVTDFSWGPALAVAAGCAVAERGLLRRQGQASMISKTRLRSGASGANSR